MRGRIDMSNIDEGGGFLIPEGTYFAEIVECKDRTSQNGDAMIGVKFLITQGEFKNNWVWDSILISDNPDSPGYKILGRSKHFLHVIGEQYEGEIVWDSANWIGKKLRVVVYQDEYKGRKKSKINEYLPIDEATAETINDKIDDTPF